MPGQHCYIYGLIDVDNCEAAKRLESSFDMPFRRRENDWLGEYFDADVLNEHGSEIGSVKIGKPGAACA